MSKNVNAILNARNINLDIQTLRQDKVLSSSADQTLGALGIYQSRKDQEEEEEEDGDSQLPQKLTARGKKSGMFAESNYNLVNHVIWSQERLGPQYISLTSAKILYKNLDFTLFRAGEI